MDSNDKKFFVALAYTAAHEKDLDIVAFRQKVDENIKVLSKHAAKYPGKAGIEPRSNLGL